MTTFVKMLRRGYAAVLATMRNAVDQGRDLDGDIVLN